MKEVQSTLHEKFLTRGTRNVNVALQAKRLVSGNWSADSTKDTHRASSLYGAPFFGGDSTMLDEGAGLQFGHCLA
jgi:hypothetical protein